MLIAISISKQQQKNYCSVILLSFPSSLLHKLSKHIFFRYLIPFSFSTMVQQVSTRARLALEGEIPHSKRLPYFCNKLTSKRSIIG